MLLAALLADNGDQEGALKTLRRALAIRPDDPYGHMKLGRLLAESSPDAALAAFRTSYRLRPNAQPLWEMANLLRRRGDLSGAVDAYRNSLKLAPDDAATLTELVMTLCDADRLSEAMDEMKQWKLRTESGKQGARTPPPPSDQKRPSPKGAPNGGDATEGRMPVLLELSRLLPSDPHTSSKLQELFLKEAVRLENTGDWAGATKAFLEAIPLNPQNPRAVRSLDASLTGRDSAERRSIWERVWKEYPDAAPIAACCAASRAVTGDLEGAILAYRHSLSLTPDDSFAFEGLVTALCEAGHLPEALDVMKRWQEAGGGKKEGPPLAVSAEETAPASPGGATDDGGAETRVSVLLRLLRLLPPGADAACRLQPRFIKEAERLENTGDRSGAVEALLTAIRLNPQSAGPLESLDKILSKGSPAECRDVWERVWKEHPGMVTAAVHCGAARAATGNLSGAKEAFETAQRLALGDCYPWIAAGDAFAEAGAWTEAIASYEHALSINPSLGYVQGRLDSARTVAAGGLPPGKD